MAEKEAQFRFVNYQILESEIRFSPETQANQKLNVTFNRTIGVNESDSKMRLELEATIENEDKSVFVHVKTCGYFEFESQISEDLKNTFFNTSAPAILFPYVRAYVSALTSLSGVEPIILPTLNLANRNAE